MLVVLSLNSWNSDFIEKFSLENVTAFLIGFGSWTKLVSEIEKKKIYLLFLNQTVEINFFNNFFCNLEKILLRMQ